MSLLAVVVITVAIPLYGAVVWYLAYKIGFAAGYEKAILARVLRLPKQPLESNKNSGSF